MLIERLRIPDVLLITPQKHGDERGFFSETWNQRSLQEAGLDLRFVQDNHSFSAPVGTLRGLHFQAPPAAQTKLVRVLRGAIFDVAVDLRKGSPSYGQYASARISAIAWNQLLVPEGFAHGFVTLEANTEVLYKVTDYYSPQLDRGLLWSDPALQIPWPIAEQDALLSARDRKHPHLAELDSPFDWTPGRQQA